MHRNATKPARRLAALSLCALALACGGSDGGSGDGGADLAAPPVGEKPATLEEWNLFADAAAQLPKDDVVPYDVTSPLFSDYALKHRFLYVPPGEQIAYEDTGRWDLPVGSVMVKTFAYPVDERDPSLGEQLIETRLLVHEPTGWTVFTYEWDEDQSEAVRLVAGRSLAVTWTGADGNEQRVDEYRIPANGQCRRCHGGGSATDTRLLGPSVGMLDRDFDHGEGPVSQIDHLDDLGLLDMAPLPAAQRVAFADPEDAGVPAPERARGYLDANCSHCHAPDGETAEKELFLDYASTDPVLGDPADWGACKRPTSAGNTDDCEQEFDVVPGDPDDSLLLCRMEIDGTGRMPEVGRSVPHEEGLALVRAWIADMPTDLLGEGWSGCTPPAAAASR